MCIRDRTFSDGTPITAVNYLAQVMAFSTPVAVAAGMPGTLGQSFVGYKEFNAYTGEEAEGTSKIFSGIRLLDEYTFSVTVSSDYLPYYFAYTCLLYTSGYYSETAKRCPAGDC